MKIRELLEAEEDKPKEKMPHLYLDMDGVQADFFGAWSKRSGVGHWKAIADKEAEINQLAHSKAENVYNFFRDLAPLRSGMQVLRWIKQNNIPFTVLSAPLRGPYSGASISAKKDWLDEFNPGTSGNAIFTQDKFKYALKDGVPQVLVDDFGKYLNAWSGAGGIAVKHEDEYEDPDSGQNTIKQLERIYSKYLNK